jgi:hypothetical protein
MVHLACGTRTITFTGDLGRRRADASEPLRKLSNLAVRRASSRSSSGGNKFFCARRSAKILSRS